MGGEGPFQIPLPGMGEQETTVDVLLRPSFNNPWTRLLLLWLSSVVFSKVISVWLDLANLNMNDLFEGGFQNPERSISGTILHKHTVALSGSCFA